MADTEFQQEFNLEAALSALRSTPADNPWQAAAEGWIQTHVADLEAKAKVAAMIVRVAVTEIKPGDALVFTLRDAAGMDYDGYLHYLDALKKLVARELGHPVPVLLVDGADVSVVRTMRTPEDQFRSEPILWDGLYNVERTFDAVAPSPQIKEDEQASDVPAWQKTLDSVVSGQPAPEHLSEGRLPKRDLATGELLEQECESVQVFFGRDVSCARERWHTGPHMDRTAIAHAGKAGEVWE